MPSAKYEETVCTAGVRVDGSFVRLYPINFRDLPFSKQYKKYQWVSVLATKHVRDHRKESYRPDSNALARLGDPIPARNGDWSERAKYVLKNVAGSVEELQARRKEDSTSLGIIRPADISDMKIDPDDSSWKPSVEASLRQLRLWDENKSSRMLPRKVPFVFKYRFKCEDRMCNGHRMSNQDWELGSLYWKLVDAGASPQEAADKVKQKFFDELCGSGIDTHFFLGNTLAHPASWMVLGVWWPKLPPKDPQLALPLRDQFI
jgi:hypothetical protein